MYRRTTFLVAAVVLLTLAVVVSGQENSAAGQGNGPVRFVILGDRTGGHLPGIYEQVISEVERLHPDFVVTVGDHIEGYTEDTVTLNRQWDEYFSIIKPLTMPIHIVPGNHDITTDGQLPVYLKRVGRPFGAFDAGSVHFIYLDNSRWETSETMPKEQMDWLVDDLMSHGKSSQVLVFFHKPFWYTSIAAGKKDTLHTLFVKYGVTAVFNGHYHQYFSGTFDGVRYTAIGSSGAELDTDPTGMGYHFAWVTVDKGVFDVAPIKMGAVLPWDVLPVSDVRVIDQVTTDGISFGLPAPVGEKLDVAATTVNVTVRNVSREAMSQDTMRWTVPAGWEVEPVSMAVTLATGASRDISFKVKGSGALYPVPSVSLNFPYKAGKTIPVKRDLAVARTATCVRVSKAPVIDGEVTEAVWQNPEIRFFSPNGDPAKTESTYCYFAYDKSNLYLAARCKESRTDSIRAASTARDGAIFGEDCVGYFIQPNMLKDTVYQIYFNALGTIFDQKISRGATGDYVGDKTWNGNYKVKTSRGNGYWSVEAQVPLANLGVKVAKGMKGRINFLRKQQHLRSNADWQAPIDYNPNTFGYLLFQ